MINVTRSMHFWKTKRKRKEMIVCIAFIIVPHWHCIIESPNLQAKNTRRRHLVLNLFPCLKIIQCSSLYVFPFGNHNEFGMWASFSTSVLPILQYWSIAKEFFFTVLALCFYLLEVSFCYFYEIMNSFMNINCHHRGVGGEKENL